MKRIYAMIDITCNKLDTNALLLNSIIIIIIIVVIIIIIHKYIDVI
jgi:hypothetical protein